MAGIQRKKVAENRTYKVCPKVKCYSPRPLRFVDLLIVVIDSCFQRNDT